ELPNTSLTAVFFDGRRYSAAHQRIDYDASERALSLKITADKAEYRPGDTVRLTVRATDSAQRPTAATVNLNVVDEALYAVSSENVDLVGDLYTGYSARVPADELDCRPGREAPVLREPARLGQLPRRRRAGDRCPHVRRQAKGGRRRDDQRRARRPRVADDESIGTRVRGQGDRVADARRRRLHAHGLR